MDNFWIRGSPNAAVFPLPVYEFAIIESPDKIEGIDSFWIGVGVWYWSFSHVLNNKGDNPSLLNDISYDIIIINTK